MATFYVFLNPESESLIVATRFSFVQTFSFFFRACDVAPNGSSNCPFEGSHVIKSRCPFLEPTQSCFLLTVFSLSVDEHPFELLYTLLMQSISSK